MTFDIRRVEGPAAYQPWSYSGNETKNLFPVTYTEPKPKTNKKREQHHEFWMSLWMVCANGTIASKLQDH